MVTSSQQNDNGLLPMSVDVRLCGSLSREDLKHLSSRTSRTALPQSRVPLRNGFTSDPTYQHYGRHRLQKLPQDRRPIGNLKGLVLVPSRETMGETTTPASLLQPPSWAVPARGEARLEPVGETCHRQTAVDLTTRSAFWIGRSPNCHVQLHHATCSRRHALLFHHANGSAYLIDCSIHGTYVNGKRMEPTYDKGAVVPFRVKRGALVRFGGVGAPTFILKSFGFCLQDVVKDDEVCRNTRLNALGRSALAESVMRGKEVTTILDKAMDVVCRKRSFDSLDSNITVPLEEPNAKRLRCSSPACNESPLRLVSPDLPMMVTTVPKKTVVFDNKPPRVFHPATITPEESSEEDNDV